MANREAEIPNQVDTKFRIASISKQFTAMAILMLKHQGKLDVKDFISKHLSDCPEHWQAITIHHLLTHTSGLPRYDMGLDFQESMHLPVSVDEIIASFKNQRLVFQPGENWQYSNSNYVVLGKIIEQVTGQSYESFLVENIFTPLGMESTGYDHNNPELAVGYKDNEVADYIDMSWPFAARGLYSTVEDLYIWDQALYTEKLVPRQLLDQMFSGHVLIPNNKIKDNEYAYGWIIKHEQGSRVATHDGGINGFSCLITHYTDKKSLIIILTNQENLNCYTIQFEILKKLFPNKEIDLTVEVD